MEIWDLYTADGQLSGQTIRRGEKIPQGYYHLVSEVLVRHRDGCYLLMRRAASKKIYPGCWEATAGGSVLAGETALEGARRELREETGIENAELTPMGCQVCDLTGSIYHSFLAVTDWGRDSVKLQPGETEGFRWFSEKEFREFWQTGNPVPIQKRRLLPWLKEMGYVDPGEQVPLTAPELVDLAVRMMRLMAIGYVCISVTQVLGGVMRGAGDTVTPMWISIISTILLRVPCAYLLAYLTRSAEYPNGQPQALFGSLMISWTLGMIISAVVFRMGHWRKKMIESMKSYQMRE